MNIPHGRRAHCLSHDDGCMNFLEVGEGGRLVRYIGRGRDDLEAASVRSNAPVAPSPMALGYFEAQIVDAGRDGFISIGLMNKRTPLDKLVGWAEGAVGYHGDDGNLFVGSGTGRAFGPLYSTGDTVGCGIDWIKEQIFFTKNGHVVGTVKSPFIQEEELYGAVGLRTPKETMQVNFGQSKFLFDVDQYFGDLSRSTLSSKVDVIQTDHQKVISLILDYCLFNGYTETLKSFVEYTFDGEDYSNIMMQRRKQLAVQEAINEGKHILDFVSDAYPDAMGDQVLLFHMQVLDFTEFFFSNPQNLEVVLEKADAIKVQADQLDKRDRDDVDKLVFGILVYDNPKQSDSANNTRQYWRGIVKSELEQYACCKNNLLTAFESVQQTICENKKGPAYSKRIWTLLDSVELWLPGFTDLQFLKK